jgi:hypothetical protein
MVMILNTKQQSQMMKQRINILFIIAICHVRISNGKNKVAFTETTQPFQNGTELSIFHLVGLFQAAILF